MIRKYILRSIAIKNKWFMLSMAIGFIMAMQGCQSGNPMSSKDLIVIEQTDTVYGKNEDNKYDCAAFMIDVPIDGPKLLVDSVMAFLNREMYDYCEFLSHLDDSVVTYSPEEVFTDDGKQLLNHYKEKYMPLLKDSLCNTSGIELKLEVQTESYVTYGLVNYHCGASCGSEKYYYIFNKRDGHQIQEVISHENLVRFFEDYPEYVNREDYLWKYSPESNYDNSCYGLLDDHFSLVIIGWYNHYFSVDVPYSQIFSYLSPEAQAVVGEESDGHLVLPPYLPERSENQQVWMEVDSINSALIGYARAAGGPLVDTLKHYDSALEAYPKRVYAIDASEGRNVYLFIYSFGHLLYLDEAMTCTIEEGGLKPANLFAIEGERDSVVSCMWYDQTLEASDGFPFDSFDENRFGLHYDPFTKRLYSPILENHDEDSEFANTSCLRYTGRFEVLQFNGEEFVHVDDDGAWWLNSDLRNYKRTISNRITADGIEQIDLMPDGTYRRAVWKGAKTLDDLRKKPDEVKVSKDMYN